MNYAVIGKPLIILRRNAREGKFIRNVKLRVIQYSKKPGALAPLPSTFLRSPPRLHTSVVDVTPIILTAIQ